MLPEVISGFFALGGVIVGGIFSWWLQKTRASADLLIALEAVKTEYMAEKTAQHYLNHKGYTDRSFELLSKRLGGFQPDELRKILVRAGAVRYIRNNGDEYWRLLSRVRETQDKRNSDASLGADNGDL